MLLHRQVELENMKDKVCFVRLPTALCATAQSSFLCARRRFVPEASIRDPHLSQPQSTPINPNRSEASHSNEFITIGLVQAFTFLVQVEDVGQPRAANLARPRTQHGLQERCTTVSPHWSSVLKTASLVSHVCCNSRGLEMKISRTA